MSNKQQKNMGEGNREADKKYREDTRKFVKSGKVKPAAEKAKQESGQEDLDAERIGKSRAKELEK